MMVQSRRFSVSQQRKGEVEKSQRAAAGTGDEETEKRGGKEVTVGLL